MIVVHVQVSGTTERTDNTLGRGIGTRGFQLQKDRHGRPKFELFWVYTFLDDFKRRLDLHYHRLGRDGSGRGRHGEEEKFRPKSDRHIV
jgi:hypothetical protein